MITASTTPRFDTERCRQLLGDPDTRGLTIYSILLDRYGPTALHGDEDEEAWDPIVLYNQIETDFRITFPVENENRLQAVLTALETDAFYTDPMVFSAICMALGEGDLGDIVNGTLEEISLPEALWGLIEVGLLRDDEQTMDPPVAAVMTSLIQEEREDPADSSVVSAVLDTADDLRRELESLGVPSGHLDAIAKMLDNLLEPP